MSILRVIDIGAFSIHDIAVRCGHRLSDSGKGEVQLQKAQCNSDAQYAEYHRAAVVFSPATNDPVCFQSDQSCCCTVCDKQSFLLDV